MADFSSIISAQGQPASTDLLSSQFALWAIYASGSSSTVIDPDSFVDFEIIGEARASDYPVEQGAFASYNKVQVPREIRIKLACSNDNMRRGDFLQQLEVMKQAVDVYDISTPDLLYESFTLTRYDYTRKATNGVSMIVAELGLEEVRQTGSASFSSSGATQSNSPSAADPQDAGTVSPDDLQPSQNGAVFGAGVG